MNSANTAQWSLIYWEVISKFLEYPTLQVCLSIPRVLSHPFHFCNIILAWGLRSPDISLILEEATDDWVLVSKISQVCFPCPHYQSPILYTFHGKEKNSGKTWVNTLGSQYVLCVITLPWRENWIPFHDFAMGEDKQYSCLSLTILTYILSL